MSDRASELVVSIAKTFIELMLSTNAEEWQEAYVRCEATPQDQIEVSGSYRTQAKPDLSNVVAIGEAHVDLGTNCYQLRQELAKKSGKPFVVALVRVDSEFNYEISYEYEDPDKWALDREGRASDPVR